MTTTNISFVKPELVTNNLSYQTNVYPSSSTDTLICIRDVFISLTHDCLGKMTKGFLKWWCHNKKGRGTRPRLSLCNVWLCLHMNLLKVRKSCVCVMRGRTEWKATCRVKLGPGRTPSPNQVTWLMRGEMGSCCIKKMCVWSRSGGYQQPNASAIDWTPEIHALLCC